MIKKKYEFTNTIIIHYNVLLRQIKAVRGFEGVRKGSLGGWIEFEDNLSHEGNCWVNSKSFVSGNAKIINNAKVGSKTSVSDYICPETWVYGNAIIKDNAIVEGLALDCQVKEYSDTVCRAYKASLLAGDITISGQAHLEGISLDENVHIGSQAYLYQGNHYEIIPIGKKYPPVIKYKTMNGKFNYGFRDFTGNLDSLERYITKNIKGILGKKYKAFITLERME